MMFDRDVAGFSEVKKLRCITENLSEGIMLSKNEISLQTARILLDIKAVHIAEDQLFTLTSGKKSPVYVDCRKIISFPRARAQLMDFAVALLDLNAGPEKFSVIAGGETAGIPFSAFIADRMGLPMQYVRKKPKGFGRNARIEGAIFPQKNVLLVEDLTTDGGSKVGFVKALREAEQIVTDIFVIFEYGIFPDCQKIMQDHKVTLHSLATWWDILTLSRQEKRFSEAALDRLELFLKDPVAWQQQQEA